MKKVLKRVLGVGCVFLAVPLVIFKIFKTVLNAGITSGMGGNMDMHRMMRDDAMRMHAEAHTNAVNMHNQMHDIAHTTAMNHMHMM